jgi:hypothetical protein
MFLHKMKRSASSATVFNLRLPCKRMKQTSGARDAHFLPVAIARPPCLHATVHVRNHKLNLPNDQARLRKALWRGIFNYYLNPRREGRRIQFDQPITSTYHSPFFSMLINEGQICLGPAFSKQLTGTTTAPGWLDSRQRHWFIFLPPNPDQYFKINPTFLLD